MKGPVSLGVDISTQVLQMENIGKREQIHLEIARSKCLRISGRMDEARAMVGTTSMPTQKANGQLVVRFAASDTSVTVGSNKPKMADPLAQDSDEEEEPAEAERLESERLIELGRIEGSQLSIRGSE